MSDLQFTRPIGQTSRRALLLGGLAGLMMPRAGFAQSVGKTPAALPSSPVADPRLAALVEGVSQARLRADVEALAAFPTRWSDSADFGAVEDWMAATFEAVGTGATATRQPFVLPSGTARTNIIWGDPMAGRGVILIGAHLDSISENPKEYAPGANDNASGIAAMLEAQRVLSGLGFDREIVFVAFPGEEQDLIGSTACAEIAARDGWPIELVINLDMVGWHPPNADAPIVIEYDQGNEAQGNDAAARHFAEMSAQMAAAYTTLNSEHTDIWDSDYMPFEAQGFPCIGFYDNGADSAEYHSTADVPDLVDYGRLEQVARLLAATAATAAGVSEA